MQKKIKRKITFIISLICFILISFSVNAQTNISSPYSRYGIGDLNSRGFSQNDALGGIGIGLRNNKNLNNINPASYSSIDTLTFIFEFGVKNKFVFTETQSDKEVQNDMNISYLACGFPISGWWYSSIGLMPYSSIGYNIKELGTFGNVNEEILYTGTGGINKFYFGNSFKLHKTLSVGVNASYLFGTIEHAKTVKFTDTTTLYMNFKSQNYISISDFYLNFGVQYSNKINDRINYTVGAVFDNKSNISSTRNSVVSRFYNKGGSSIIDTVINTPNEKGDIMLPLNYGLGVVVKTQKWLFGADYYRQNWADTEFFKKNDSLANSNSIAAGAEFIPDRNAVTKYWQKVSYRFGAHFSDTYLKFSDKNEQLKDIGFSIGLGLPVKKTRSLLNIAFEFGRRGTTNKNLIQETYGIVSLNFTLSDIWFIKSKFD